MNNKQMPNVYEQKKNNISLLCLTYYNEQKIPSLVFRLQWQARQNEVL